VKATEAKPKLWLKGTALRVDRDVQARVTSRAYLEEMISTALSYSNRNDASGIHSTLWSLQTSQRQALSQWCRS
jgi:hypothetical protein